MLADVLRAAGTLGEGVLLLQSSQTGGMVLRGNAVSAKVAQGNDKIILGH